MCLQIEWLHVTMEQWVYNHSDIIHCTGPMTELIRKRWKLVYGTPGRNHARAINRWCHNNVVITSANKSMLQMRFLYINENLIYWSCLQIDNYRTLLCHQRTRWCILRFRYACLHLRLDINACNFLLQVYCAHFYRKYCVRSFEIPPLGNVVVISSVKITNKTQGLVSWIFMHIVCRTSFDQLLSHSTVSLGRNE